MSEDSRRDRSLRMFETSTFPTATFSLTTPIALDGQLVGEQVVVVGSTEIGFADFDIEPPTSIALTSVEDARTMAFEPIFQQS